MKIYVAMLHDPYNDPTAHLFSELDRAVEFVRDELPVLASIEPAKIVESNPPPEGYLWHATDGDSGFAWVTAQEVDQDVRDAEAIADREAERYRQGGDFHG